MTTTRDPRPTAERTAGPSPEIRARARKPPLSPAVVRPRAKAPTPGDAPADGDRAQTDASLDAERTVVDPALETEYESSDAERDELREAADRSVESVRVGTDERLAGRTADAQTLASAIRRERLVHDEALATERAQADEGLEQERGLRAQSEAAGLEEQRVSTDENLAKERVHSDLVLDLVEEPFRLLADQVKDYAIFVLDLQGNVVSWNAGAQRLNGYRADEIVGKHISMLYTHEDLGRGKPREHLRAAERDGRVEVEGWRVRKDGAHYLAHVIITCLRDTQNNHRGFIKITRDVTEQRTSAERELERAQQSLQMVNRHVEAIAALHEKAETNVDSHQRRVERVMGRIGRPRTLYLFLSTVVAWALANWAVVQAGGKAWDPLPCFFLQGVVAIFGVVMSTVVLITQIRQQQQAQQRAYLDLQVNLAAEQKTAKVIDLLEELRRDLPTVRNRIDHEAAAMTKAIDPHVMMAALDETLQGVAKARVPTKAAPGSG